MKTRKPTATLILLVLFCAGRALAIQDENSNGMSDLWESAYHQGLPFSPHDPDHDPSADPDGDGWTNHEESIAGTDPFVADSPRQAARFGLGGGGGVPARTLSWPSVEGKLYQLSVTAKLDDWHEQGDPVPGTGGMLEFELPHMAGEPGVFVRVGVRDEDPDGDRLSSWEEIQLGTNRLLADTDDDGKPDGVELSENTNPLGHSATTDSDGDGLLDIDDALPGDPQIAWPKADSVHYVLIDLGDEVAGWTPVGLADDFTILFAEGMWKQGQAIAHDFPATVGTVNSGTAEAPSQEPYEVEGTRGFGIAPDGGTVLADARAWATEGRWLDESVNWNTVSLFGPGLEEAWDASNGHGFGPGKSAAFWPIGLSATEVFTIRKDPFGEVDPPPTVEVFPLGGGNPSSRVSPPNYQPVVSSDPLHSDTTESGWLACNLGRVSAGEGGPPWRLGLWNPAGEWVPLPAEADGWKWPVCLTEFSNGEVALTAGNENYFGEVLVQAPDGGFERSEHFADENVRMIGGNGTALAADNRLWVNGEWVETEVWCPQLADTAASGAGVMALDSNRKGGYLVRVYDLAQASMTTKLLVPGGFVPDYNRDGKIDLADRGKVTRENPWRWWINNDNDLVGEERGNNGRDIPGGPGAWDCADLIVDGMRDLIDFFPLHLDLRAIVDLYPQAEYGYYLAHAEKAVQFYEYPACIIDGSDPSHYPNRHIKSVGVGRGLSGKQLKRALPQGVELGESFVESCGLGKGILVVEGAQKTLNRLMLEVKRRSDGVLVAEFEFPLNIVDVEDMYRHVNMRDATDGSGGRLSRTGEPLGYPDALTNGRYLMYIHGFNVSGESARGSQSNLFKRFHQLGSKDRFVALYWHGDPPNPGLNMLLPPDYHRAVYNALMTSIAMPVRLSFMESQDISVIAHSLGNMLASSAIANHDLTVSNYFIVNGAVPMQAYDSEQNSIPDGDPDMARYMTEDDWKSYYDYDGGSQRRLMAANWYQLFEGDPEDRRNDLTWKGIFEKRALLDVAHNFYSPSDHVVENPDDTEEFSHPENLHDSAFEEGRHAWVQQEIGKGGQSLVASPAFHDINGGWSFNSDAYKWVPSGNSGRYKKKTPYEASLLADSDLISKPFFRYFLYRELHHPIHGKDLADSTAVRNRLLATGVPATSYAVAANPCQAFSAKVLAGVSRNYDMPKSLVSPGGKSSWPAHVDAFDPSDWMHSDFKDVAIQFTLPLYEKFIKIANSDEI